MSSLQMAQQIDLFRIAPEGHPPVAKMRSGDERLSKVAKGHTNIATLIAHGWVIIPDQINRLLPEYQSACLVGINTNDPAPPYVVETPSVHKGRPKGSKNKYKRDGV